MTSANAKVKDLERDVRNPSDKTVLTTDFGQKTSNTDNWLKVTSDERTGPSLLEDQQAREKIHRFDHERIPERVVHARGAAAHGVFRLHEDASDVSHAGVLTDTSRETPIFLRFSTVQGSRGSADSVRDVRGFAVKFYTQEGNWDIVGNDIPVFFIQDSIKFPDIVHAVKPEPKTEVPQAQSAHNNFWDFVNLHTEATHMYMWAMSDRGIPRSYRMMQGFGVNTYSLVNHAGDRNFVKFHFTPELGVHSFMWDEALKLAGQDPDFHRKDLYEAIDNKGFPKWKFGIQVIPESKQDDFEFDILDATKLWPEDQVPVRYIGEIELNRNVDEYFPETEQVAFCTSHIVPGIDFSDDPLLQGRNFSYFDTQISRLGINWQELPINRPVCPVMTNNRDGQLRHTITNSSVNYWPNRFSEVPPASPKHGGFQSYPAPVTGRKQRALSLKFREHYKQAQLFYNSLSQIEKVHLTSALSFELDHCTDPIVYERMSERLAYIDLSLAQTVASKVGGPIPQKAALENPGHKAPRLSQSDFMPENPTIATRRIAILITDGYDALSYNGMVAAIKAAQALPYTIGPHRHPVKTSGDRPGARPDHHFQGMRSTMFDAVFVPGGPGQRELAQDGLARFWVREAFGHCKAIASVGAGNQLVRAALSEVPTAQVAADSSDASHLTNWYGVITAGEPETEGWGKKVFELARNAGEAKDLVEAFFSEIGQHRNWQRELDGLTSQVSC